MWYADLKVAIEQYTGLDRDALHVHAAILIYLVSMFVFRQSRRSRFPWIVVFVFQVTNEAFDLRRGTSNGGGLDLAESAKDMWNTMLWPTVLLFMGRYTTLFQHRRHSERLRREAEGASSCKA